MVSPVKSKVLAIAPKFTAFLSICGSLGIVLKVLSNASRRKKTMHRIMASMSICDILASTWYFVGTWAIPKKTTSWFGDGDTEKIFWAAGDESGISCSFAGFFNQFAVATPIYNTTLATFFLLVIFYGWSDARIVRIEWLLHTIPIGYALISSIFAVAADLYGHVEWTCWILPEEFFDETQELTPIQNKFRMIQWIFLFGVVWACIIFQTITFVILYRKMRSLEHVMRRYSFTATILSRFSIQHSQQSVVEEEQQKGSMPYAYSSKANKSNSKFPYTTNAGCATSIESSVTLPSNNDTLILSSPTNMADQNSSNGDANNLRPHMPRQARREVAKSRKIAMQGLLYVGAFYITWLFPTISRITELAAGTNYFPIQFLDTFLLPLQGFLNFLIYIRPAFLNHQKNNAEDGFWKSLKTVVFENRE